MVATEPVGVQSLKYLPSSLHRKGVPIPDIEGSSPEFRTEEVLSRESFDKKTQGLARTGSQFEESRSYLRGKQTSNQQISHLYLTSPLISFITNPFQLILT